MNAQQIIQLDELGQAEFDVIKAINIGGITIARDKKENPYEVITVVQTRAVVAILLESYCENFLN